MPRWKAEVVAAEVVCPGKRAGSVSRHLQPPGVEVQRQGQRLLSRIIHIPTLSFVMNIISTIFVQY
jgi:hypothetical protein